MIFFYAALKRELLLIFRHRSDIINPLAFFLMVAVLFPLGVSPDPSFLSEVASGVIWVAALLACLLSIDGIFRNDYQDGSLEQMLVSAESLWVIITAKVITHWLVSGVCLALIAPLVAMMFFLPEQAYTSLIVSLLLGTPTLSLMGAIGAALTVGLRKGGVLISLLVLPLYIPVLIFGAATVQAGAMGLPIQGYLALLAAILIFSLMLAPIAIVAALKISVRS
jgi:heme exporter protein B